MSGILDLKRSGSNDDDANILAGMGYKQDLYRGLDGFMAFAIGYTEVGVLASIVGLFTYSLQTGGPVTIIWTWIVASVFTFIVALCMAEICSAYPGAGSVYYWSGQLAPREWAPLASYWTGITNWLGNASGDASFAFMFAMMLSATLEVSGYSALSTPTQVGVSVAILAVWSVINFTRIDQVGWMINLAAFVQVGTTLAVLLTILIMAPKLNSSEFVFFDYNNDTGFTSVYYVVAISLLLPLYSFAGYDASGHVAEETQDSRINAPMGIITSVGASAVFGFILILALLYGVQSVPLAISSATGNAAVQIFLQATNTPCAVGA